MKVAILTSRCKPGGGTYTALFNLCKYLSKMPNLDVYIISYEYEDTIKKFCNFCTIKKNDILLVGKLFDALSIEKKIKEIDPDIIHVQGQMLRYLTMTPMFDRLKSKYPVISTIHGISKIEQKYHGMSGVNIKINSYIEKITLSRISNIIVCSPWMKDMVNSIINKNNNICIIPNGIDFDEIQRRESKLSNINSPSIFFVGVLEKVKGLEILLRAIPIILEYIPEVSIYIAGTGSQEIKLKRLIKELDIEENVTFLGYISEDEKYSYFKSTDICVFPSIYEPFGIVLLEAMACEKPVVASNTGGIPFVVEDGKTGILFGCGNIGDLATKIVILLKDKELQGKMGRAGKERSKQFTWEKIAGETIELYKKILFGINNGQRNQ